MRETPRECKDGEGSGGAFKSRKGFSYDIGKAPARPSNTTIGDLLGGGGEFADAVPALLRDSKVGVVND